MITLLVVASQVPIGGVMQVLVIIVQNGVPHSELGWRPPVPRRLRSVSQPAPGREIRR